MMKKLFVTSFVVALLIGGTHVFASSVLNINIINLIKAQISGAANLAVNDVNTKLDIDKKTLKDTAKEIVKGKQNETKTRINEYKNQELVKAETEMNQYVQQLQSEVDTVLKGEEELAKTKIKAKKDEKVNEFKQELLTELENELK